MGRHDSALETALLTLARTRYEKRTEHSINVEHLHHKLSQPFDLEEIITTNGIQEDAHHLKKGVEFIQEHNEHYANFFTYKMHENAIILSSRPRKLLNIPYPFHTLHAFINRIKRGSHNFVNSKSSLRYFVESSLGDITHDNAEEIVEYYKITDPKLHADMRASVLREFYDRDILFIDTYVSSLDVSDEEKKHIREDLELVALNTLHIQDKQSRNRHRKKSVENYFADYLPKFKGVTRLALRYFQDIFSSQERKSNNIHSLQAISVQCDEQSNNLDTLWTNKNYRQKTRDMTEEQKEELNQVVLELEPAMVQENFRVLKEKYDRGKAVEQALKKRGSTIRLETTLTEYEQIIAEGKPRGDSMESILRENTSVLSATKRLAFLTKAFWSANLALDIANQHKGKRGTVYLVRDAISAALYTLQDVKEKAVYEQHVHNLYNGVHLHHAERIRNHAREYLNSPYAFKITKSENTDIPPRWRDFDKLSTYAIRIAQKDKSTLKKFENDPMLQYRLQVILEVMAEELIKRNENLVAYKSPLMQEDQRVVYTKEKNLKNAKITYIPSGPMSQAA